MMLVSRAIFKALFSRDTKFCFVCVCVCAFSPPTTRQLRWHNCISATEIQTAIWGERERKKKKQFQTSSFICCVEVWRLRKCDRVQVNVYVNLRDFHHTYNQLFAFWFSTHRFVVKQS